MEVFSGYLKDFYGTDIIFKSMILQEKQAHEDVKFVWEEM